MFLELFVKGVIIGLCASIPLGPIGVLCVQKTINKNRRAGFYAGLGAASSDTIYAIIAGFSLNYIIEVIRTHEVMFRFFGAGILIILGWHIFKSDPSADVQKFKRKTASYWQDYFFTFLLTFSNPLAILIFFSIFARFKLVINTSDPLPAAMLIGGIFIGATLWWFSLTSLVNMFRHKFNMQNLRLGNRIAGSVIIVFAVTTLLFYWFG
ncbi:LysE family translocator [Halosquirtibacter xylanolyticus]|uniref:LysE family translocator n=1 Tax=Halosquirtibacter xylanolyticus TaxID=3374599 RepID=UPI00374A1CB7|nr:LysE family translocator [Prolixibacteraceae bacterium]